MFSLFREKQQACEKVCRKKKSWATNSLRFTVTVAAQQQPPSQLCSSRAYSTPLEVDTAGAAAASVARPCRFDTAAHAKCGRAAWRPHELAIQLKSSGIVQATTTWNKDDIRLGTVCFSLGMPIAGAFELAGVTHVLDLNSKAHTCPTFFGLQSRPSSSSGMS